jgi:hypothetical protein
MALCGGGVYFTMRRAFGAGTAIWNYPFFAPEGEQSGKTRSSTC